MLSGQVRAGQNVTMSLIFLRTPVLTLVPVMRLSKSAQSLKLPLARSARIDFDRAAPTPGRVSSSLAVAVLMFTALAPGGLGVGGAPGAGPSAGGGAGPRRRRGGGAG